MKRLFLVFGLLVCSIPALPAQSVFLVRHAEKATTGDAKDPDLSKAGRNRSKSLQTLLKDAGITAIYATEFKRTQETANAVGRAAGIPVTIVPASDTVALVAKLKEATGITLVVGHSNTLPEIIKGLGVSVPITIGEGDYDNLFVITPGSPPHFLRLHYR